MERITAIFHNSKWKNAMELLARYEEERIYCCHGPEHLLAVARIAWILYLEEDRKGAKPSPYDGNAKELIYAAALLHDIGRVKEYECGMDHHLASVEMARDILSECGFDADECEPILEAIGSHRKDRAAFDRISESIRRADNMSRLCFDCGSANTCKWSDERKNREIVC